jgi:hypothetical protein
LLLICWALNLPVLRQEIVLLAWQYPTHRNITLRLLEPLEALEETAGQARNQQTLGADGWWRRIVDVPGSMKTMP